MTLWYCFLVLFGIVPQFPVIPLISQCKSGVFFSQLKRLKVTLNVFKVVKMVCFRGVSPIPWLFSDSRSLRDGQVMWWTCSVGLFFYPLFWLRLFWLCLNPCGWVIDCLCTYFSKLRNQWEIRQYHSKIQSVFKYTKHIQFVQGVHVSARECLCFKLVHVAEKVQ